MKDFATEWAKVKRGEPSALFASDMLYGVKQPRRTPLTTKQQAQRQVTYHPTPNPTVWKEYSGHSQHRTQGYSPILMEQHSKHAQAVFQQADYVLSKLRSRW